MIGQSAPLATLTVFPALLDAALAADAVPVAGAALGGARVAELAVGVVLADPEAALAAVLVALVLREDEEAEVDVGEDADGGAHLGEALVVGVVDLVVAHPDLGPGHGVRAEDLVLHEVGKDPEQGWSLGPPVHGLVLPGDLTEGLADQFTLPAERRIGDDDQAVLGGLHEGGVGGLVLEEVVVEHVVPDVLVLAAPEGAQPRVDVQEERALVRLVPDLLVDGGRADAEHAPGPALRDGRHDDLEGLPGEVVLRLLLVLLDLVQHLRRGVLEVVHGQLGGEVVGLVLPDLDVDEDGARVAEDDEVGPVPAPDLLQLGLLGRHLLALDKVLGQLLPLLTLLLVELCAVDEVEGTLLPVPGGGAGEELGDLPVELLLLEEDRGAVWTGGDPGVGVEVILDDDPDLGLGGGGGAGGLGLLDVLDLGLWGERRSELLYLIREIA